MNVPLKIGVYSSLSAHNLIWKSLLHSNVVLSSSCSLRETERIASLPVLEDDKTGRGVGFRKMLGLALAGCAVGAGLLAFRPDNYVLKGAHCEAASLAVQNQLPSSGMDSPSPVLNSVEHFSDWIRRRIFFTYERRIRAYSSPQKVFEYFASIKDSKKQYFMTPGDLLRALIPVLPPSESSVVRAGYLVGERQPGELHCSPSKFFMLFDTNADGWISFEEYKFIKALLTVSLESFTATFKMFDRDGDGFIDLYEFKKVMRLMRKRGITEHSTIHTTRHSEDPTEGIKLLKFLFGENGEKILQYEEFILFLKQLHEEILLLEFSHYDCNQGCSIPAQDFGSSMVAAASLSNINKYLDRVDSIGSDPNFKDIRISYEDFRQFSELRKKRRLLALSGYAAGGIHGLSKEDFQWSAAQVCQVSLSNAAVDVIFHIFDSDGDGKLSLSEFLGVQDLRETGLVDPLQPGLVHTVRCIWNCAKNRCNSGVSW